jgi:hypothetical protein
MAELTSYFNLNKPQINERFGRTVIAIKIAIDLYRKYDRMGGGVVDEHYVVRENLLNDLHALDRAHINSQIFYYRRMLNGKGRKQWWVAGDNRIRLSQQVYDGVIQYHGAIESLTNEDINYIKVEEEPQPQPIYRELGGRRKSRKQRSKKHRKTRRH